MKLICFPKYPIVFLFICLKFIHQTFFPALKMIYIHIY